MGEWVVDWDAMQLGGTGWYWVVLVPLGNIWVVLVWLVD